MGTAEKVARVAWGIILAFLAGVLLAMTVNNLRNGL